VPYKNYIEDMSRCIDNFLNYNGIYFFENIRGLSSEEITIGRSGRRARFLYADMSGISFGFEMRNFPVDIKKGYIYNKESDVFYIVVPKNTVDILLNNLKDESQLCSNVEDFGVLGYDVEAKIMIHIRHATYVMHDGINTVIQMPAYWH